MTKIVRKNNGRGWPVEFTLDSVGRVVVWHRGFGWRTANAAEAHSCGTTLAALRDELTEEGKDGGR